MNKGYWKRYFNYINQKLSEIMCIHDWLYISSRCIGTRDIATYKCMICGKERSGY